EWSGSYGMKRVPSRSRLDIAIDALELVLASTKGLQDGWVELALGFFQEDLGCLSVVKGRLVGTLAAQGIINVRDGYQPRCSGNAFPRQPIRVARAVVALVMMTDDGRRHSQENQ